MCSGVSDWCLTNKMTLNALKTVFLIVCKFLFDRSHLSLLINGVEIAPSTDTYFLGVIVDYRLKSDLHVTNKIAAAKRLFVFFG